MSDNSPKDPLAELARLARIALPAAPIRPIARGVQLGFRRTLIPPLLTAGLGLPGIAAAWWMQPADSPYRRIGVGVPIVMILLGALLLLFAIANMLFVRAALRRAVGHDRV